MALITTASGGRLEMKPLSGGSIVPANKEYDGIDSGAVEFAHTVPSFWLDKSVSAGLFAYQTGGLSPFEIYGWITQGGGGGLLQEMLAGTNILYLPGSGHLSTPEVFMHSDKPMKSLSDLKGLKMRAGGDGGEVMKRLGASVVMMPGLEIYENMKRGVIDAYESAAPTFEWAGSFQEVGKYMYLSPMRQPSEYGVFIVNKKSWSALPDDLKVLVTEISRTMPMKLLYSFIASDAEAIQKFKNYGVIVEQLPADIGAATEKEAKALYTEKSAKDPFFAKVYNSLTSFKDNARATFPRY